MRRLIFEKSKVVIVYPGKKAGGGVSELYNIAHFQTKSIKYFELYGTLRNKFNFLVTLFMIPRFIISIRNYDIVHFNPSLGKKSFVRDAALLLLSQLSLKVIAYWHGWKDDFEERIRKGIFYPRLFNISFKKANASIVLGTILKKTHLPGL